MAVPFTEIDGSPRIRYSDGKISPFRQFKVAWGDAIPFLIELVGGFELVGGSFVYTSPAQYPGIPYCVPKDVDITVFGNGRPITSAGELSVSTNGYEFAQFDVTYAMEDIQGQGGRTDLPTVPDGTTLRYNRGIGAEYLTIPGNNLVWYDDGEPVSDDINAGILVPTIDFTLTWANVPSPPWANYDKLAGKVNADTFLGYGAEKVLFLGADDTLEFQIDRAPRYSLALAFKVRQVQSTANANTTFGWNHFYRKEPNGSEHWLKVSDEDLNPPYASASFADLFVFG